MEARPDGFHDGSLPRGEKKRSSDEEVSIWRCLAGGTNLAAGPPKVACDLIGSIDT
jgi:hypothetical protein